ncbi:hypothetical protein [Pseudoalteromonas rubra]|uniref:hypothetical protein n=1 Tax=Pseudoalteromonas rubra TaxID=43658 RepID=UPI00026C9491|nr:hypothetical protein [Pseudoalteromonas rubra]
MEGNSAFFVIYSVSQAVEALIGLVSTIIVCIAAYKFSRVKGLPWRNVLFYSILGIVAVSIAQWVTMDILMGTAAESEILVESIFFVILSIPFLLACIALYKIASHIGDDV